MKNIDQRLDGVYDFIDNILIYNKDYKLIDSIFERIDYNKWETDELIGFLTITVPFKDKFKWRNQFWLITQNRLRKKLPQKEIDIILKGLK